jgi:hypothetical protein
MKTLLIARQNRHCKFMKKRGILTLLVALFGAACCSADELQYPSFKFQQPWLQDFGSDESDNQADKVGLARTVICKTDRSAGIGFVMNFQRPPPFGVDEMVGVARQGQSAIWKVLLNKDIAVGKTVEVESFDPTAKDVFANTWSIISLHPPVIVLARTSQGANQTLVMNAHTGTFVYTTTGDLLFQLPSSSVFWGACENE